MDSRVDKLIEVVRKTVIKLFPELAGRYHLSGKARITALGEGVQAQPLTREGSDDTSAPVVKCSPLPTSLKVGNIITLAFLYGDPSEPYIISRSAAVVGTYAGGRVTVEGYGAEAVVPEHLQDHSRVATLTAPVDEDGQPLPGASTSSLTKISYKAPLKAGDQVVATPIEEGERFIVLAKL